MNAETLAALPLHSTGIKLAEMYCQGVNNQILVSNGAMKVVQNLYFTDDEEVTSVSLALKKCAYVYLYLLLKDLGISTVTLRVGLKYGVEMVGKLAKNGKMRDEHEKFRYMIYGFTVFMKEALHLRWEEPNMNKMNGVMGNMRRSGFFCLNQRQLDWLQLQDAEGLYVNHNLVNARLVDTGVLAWNEDERSEYFVMAHRHSNLKLVLALMAHAMKQYHFETDKLIILVRQSTFLLSDDALATSRFLVNHDIVSIHVASFMETYIEFVNRGNNPPSMAYILGMMEMADAVNYTLDLSDEGEEEGADEGAEEEDQ
jgi:hypothetical protein